MEQLKLTATRNQRDWGPAVREPVRHSSEREWHDANQPTSEMSEQCADEKEHLRTPIESNSPETERASEGHRGVGTEELSRGGE